MGNISEKHTFQRDAPNKLATVHISESKEALFDLLTSTAQPHEEIHLMATLTDTPVQSSLKEQNTPATKSTHTMPIMFKCSEVCLIWREEKKY